MLYSSRVCIHSAFLIGGISKFIEALMMESKYVRVPSGGAGNKMLMLLEGKGGMCVCMCDCKIMLSMLKFIDSLTPSMQCGKWKLLFRVKTQTPIFKIVA